MLRNTANYLPSKEYVKVVGQEKDVYYRQQQITKIIDLRGANARFTFDPDFFLNW